MTILDKLFRDNILETPSERVYVPIWYEFKSGQRVDLNKVIMEDFTGKFRRLHHAGMLKVKAWQKLNQILPAGRKMDVPEIVFYE